MAWTSPRTWVAGETVTAAILNTHVRDNLLDLGGTAAAWTAFTPSLTNFAGTITSARYKQIGKLVVVNVRISLTGAPTGQLTISVPVNYVSGTITNGITVGRAVATDSGTGFHFGAIFPAGGTPNTATIVGSTSLNNWNATVPFTWAASDQLSLDMLYEAA